MQLHGNPGSVDVTQATKRSLLALFCHYGLLVLAVARFGALGAAIATSVSGWMTLAFGTAAVWMVGAGPTIWGGESTDSAIKQAGAGWLSLSNLAYPSAAMRILESCGFSGIVTTSSLLPMPKIELDIMSLSLNVYGFLFTPFPALSICTDTRATSSSFHCKSFILLFLPLAENLSRDDRPLPVEVTYHAYHRLSLIFPMPCT